MTDFESIRETLKASQQRPLGDNTRDALFGQIIPTNNLRSVMQRSGSDPDVSVKFRAILNIQRCLKVMTFRVSEAFTTESNSEVKS
ncbi:hypothetical protein ACVWXN_005903 [Bradyrhizobium sp. i1.4.4]